MSTRIAPLERPGRVSGLPEPADVADLWLGHALSSLLDAAEVALADRRRLVESDTADVDLGTKAARNDVEGVAQRLDSCRLAVLFGALAVEARLDRLLRRRDATDWPAVAHLHPAERFLIARRLLDGLQPPPEDIGLTMLAGELFDLRDELVDAVGRPGAALAEISPEFNPSRADAMVGGSARLCSFLATLAGEDEGATARIVERTARAVARRASDLSPAGSGRGSIDARAMWSPDVEFPPDVVGS